WRVLALHARHRLVEDFRIVDVPAGVGVDAQPVQLALAPDLGLTHEGGVFFGLAGDHAAVASGADAGVDDHGPGVFVAVVPARVHRLVMAAFAVMRVLREFRVLLEAFEGRCANQTARANHFRIDVLMLLRTGYGVDARRVFGHGDARARSAVQRVGEGEGVGVKAGAGADLAALLASVAEVDRGYVFRVSGNDPD